jgi:hypothetical protein
MVGLPQVGYSHGVSEVQRDAAQKPLDELPAEDRAWLEEQLARYRELLQYLHDH